MVHSDRGPSLDEVSEKIIQMSQVDESLWGVFFTPSEWVEKLQQLPPRTKLGCTAQTVEEALKKLLTEEKATKTTVDQQVKYAIDHLENTEYLYCRAPWTNN